MNIFTTFCIGTVLIFSDSTWRPAAIQLEHELQRAPHICVEHIDIPRYPNQTTTAARWGTADYFARIRVRLPEIHRRLLHEPLDSTRWLALFDADIVVLRNITGRVTRTFAHAPQVHMLAQQEWPCDTAPYRLCVNGGLWFVRRSSQARDLLAHAVRVLERLHIPDQDALQLAANAAEPGAVLFLDRARYANGYVALRRPTKWSAAGAHAVHCNWLVDLRDKLKCLAHFRATRFHSAG